MLPVGKNSHILTKNIVVIILYPNSNSFVLRASRETINTTFSSFSPCAGKNSFFQPYRLIHRFSKCSVPSPRAPREQPRGSASYLLTYTILTLLILLLSKKAILGLMKFDSTLLVCLSSVKFTASMITLRNVDFF